MRGIESNYITCRVCGKTHSYGSNDMCIECTRYYMVKSSQENMKKKTTKKKKKPAKRKNKPKIKLKDVRVSKLDTIE